MATKKQEISKHKATITRKPAGNKASTSDVSPVFDIVPRGRVRASATSRPVITGNKPEVSDNTLATAPLLRYKRHDSVTITPKTSRADDDEKSEPDGYKVSTTVKERGVSVGELLAKRAGAQEGDAEVTKKETEANTNSGGFGVDVGTSIDLNADGSEAPTSATTSEADSKDALPDDDVKKDTEGDDVAEADDKSETSTKAETEEESEETTKPADSIDSDEALAKALQGDEQKPQEHSAALKEEIKNLGEDGREHQELYGGKPVIVVHKDKGALSTVMWVVWFLICVLLALGIVDVLLDASIVKTNYNIPYTDFIQDK
jgi:hypothetical protein